MASRTGLKELSFRLRGLDALHLKAQRVLELVDASSCWTLAPLITACVVFIGELGNVGAGILPAFMAMEARRSIRSLRHVLEAELSILIHVQHFSSFLLRAFNMLPPLPRSSILILLRLVIQLGAADLIVIQISIVELLAVSHAGLRGRVVLVAQSLIRHALDRDRGQLLLLRSACCFIRIILLERLADRRKDVALRVLHRDPRNRLRLVPLVPVRYTCLKVAVLSVVSVAICLWLLDFGQSRLHWHVIPGS